MRAPNRVVLSIVLVALSVIGWAGMSQAADHVPNYEPIVKDGKVDERLHGLWKSRGYGWIIRFNQDGLEMYDHTNYGCVQTDIELSDLDEIATLFEMSGDTILATWYEHATYYTLDRVKELPSACQRELADKPTVVFDYLAATMAEQYAFFDLYDMDWEARVKKNRPRVTDDTNEADLFEVLKDTLRGLKDGHLELHAEVDGKKKRFAGLRARVLPAALRTAFDAQKKEEDFGEFQTKWFFSQKKQMRKMFKKGSLGDRAGGNVMFGQIGDVGYITVYGMGGFNEDEDDDSMEGEIAAVHTIIGEAVEQLADTRAIIVDITLNQGGYDDVSLAIASHFADKKTFAYSKQSFLKGAPPQKFHVLPADGPRYTKPVYLVTSDLSVSAAEIFTMAMRALPNVTHVGDTTMGALSDILSKTLPNGWELALSHEIYLDHEGKLWEGKGLSPEYPKTIWDPATLEKSHAKAIRALAKKGLE